MLIPYNSNRLHTPAKDSEVLLAHHLIELPRAMHG